MQIHSSYQKQRLTAVPANLNVPAGGQQFSALRPELKQSLGGLLSGVVAGLPGGEARRPGPTASGNTETGQVNATRAGLATTLGTGVAQLAAQSPSLMQDLGKLEAKGWAIKHGIPGGGSYVSGKTITLDPRLNTRSMVQVLAHEVGHANDNTRIDTRSREAYVNSALTGEGRATINNIKVQREILAAGGPDIGIAGRNGTQYSRIYSEALRTGDFEKAAFDIGQIFGSRENTSTTGQTYADYYGKFYDAYF